MGNSNSAFVETERDNKSSMKWVSHDKEEFAWDSDDTQDKCPLSHALDKGILKNSIIASNNRLLQTNKAIKSTPCTIKHSRIGKQRVSIDQTLFGFYNNEEHRNLDKAIENQPTKNSEYSYNSDSEKENNRPLTFPEMNIKIQKFKLIEIHPEDLIKIQNININEKYTLEDQIGEGGFGIVYRARCKNSKELRAVKVLKKSQLTKLGRQMFKTEASILLKMDHPSIIKVYEVIQNEQMLYMVTQYCDGGSIDTYIRQFGKKDNQDIVRKIMKKLLSALIYIHSKRFIHRDLKLQNIVFKKIQINGKPDVIVKIIDFGLAKSITARRLIKENKIVGTTNYLSPQNLDGIYTPKSDVWNCGIIMHALLRGTFPFKGENKNITFKKIRYDLVNFSGLQWNHVSKFGKDLVGQMLQKQISKRLSARQALSHLWFDQSISKRQFQNISTEFVVPRLLNYYRGNNLMSFIESYIALTRVEQSERQRLIGWFNEIDGNDDGVIEEAELLSFFKKHKIQINQAKLQTVLQLIDRNGNDYIDLNEFICVMLDRNKYCTDQTLGELFQIFDANKDGFIEKSQLKQVLVNCLNEEISVLIESIDKDLDQKISKQQFILYVREQIKEQTQPLY